MHTGNPCQSASVHAKYRILKNTRQWVGWVCIAVCKYFIFLESIYNGLVFVCKCFPLPDLIPGVSFIAAFVPILHLS